MRCLAVLILFLALPHNRAHAQSQSAGPAPDDCEPFAALSAATAAPRAMTVRADAGRVHFAKDGAAQAGCPSSSSSSSSSSASAAACPAAGYVLPGDPVVVVAEHDGQACAVFTGPPPRAATTSGWLPAAALAPAADSGGPHATGVWTGDWKSGPEKAIAIRSVPNRRLALHGEATFGASDPERVQRGGVNIGDFEVTVTASDTRLAFLVGNDNAALPFDAAHARDAMLCGLRLWRLGPYLVAADNLQCGGNGVTFTGVYRRSGKPS